MTDTFRTLCGELAQQLDDALDFTVSSETRRHMKALAARARAALAQPEPLGATPEVDDILRLAAIIRRVDGNHDKGAAALAEAILGHPDSRWQHAQPEPQGPDPVDYRRWHEAHSEDCSTWSEQPTTPLTLRTTVEALAWANYCLARWGRPAIEPVPVAERPWEREGWCDADGRCWFGAPPDGAADAGWILRKPSERLSHQTASLPHHALPVPQQEATHD